MMQQFKTFKVGSAENSAEALNLFLKTHTITSVEKQFVVDGQESFYLFLIEYHSEVVGNGYEKRQKKDWAEELTEKQTAAYIALKEFRNGAAKEQGVPPFALFTNEMAAELTKLQSFSKTALKTIKGFGDAKLKKYGDTIVEILTEHLAGSDRESE